MSVYKSVGASFRSISTPRSNMRSLAAKQRRKCVSRRLKSLIGIDDILADDFWKKHDAEKSKN